MNETFSQAESRYGVPATLLKAICYMEGNLSNNAGAKLAWLAVPAGSGVEGAFSHVTNLDGSVELSSANGTTVQIYGRPTTDSQYVIGNAPAGAFFTTGYTLIEDGTSNVWYEINFNNRQAWLPANNTIHFHPNTVSPGVGTH